MVAQNPRRDISPDFVMTHKNSCRNTRKKLIHFLGGFGALARLLARMRIHTVPIPPRRMPAEFIDPIQINAIERSFRREGL